MITNEGLDQVNSELHLIGIEKKNGDVKQYAQVNERVKAFRKLEPNGKICTELISLDNGVATMRAQVYDSDGSMLATGFAQEKESASYINKTSFIENCETSAVGRALGFLGIGIDNEIASAQEVTAAQIAQERLKDEEETRRQLERKITAKEQKILTNLIEKSGLTVEEVLNGLPISEVTGAMYMDGVKRLSMRIEAIEARENG